MDCLNCTTSMYFTYFVSRLGLAAQCINVVDECKNFEKQYNTIYLKPTFHSLCIQMFYTI